MKDEILEYLKEEVKDWPKDAETVRLDKDGEICFMGSEIVSHDFFPVADLRVEWVPRKDCAYVGHLYTHEDWRV